MSKNLYNRLVLNGSSTKADVTLINKALKSNAIVLIHSPSCMFCNMMKSDWHKATPSMLKNTNVVEIESGQIYKLSKTSHSIIEKTQLSGVPHMFLVHSKTLTKYNGDRTAKSFRNFAAYS